MTSVAHQALPQELDSSFETLYRMHRASVYRSLLRDLRDPHEAEDVTQATFMNAYRALGRGDRPESPRAWLLAIARNVCRRRFRARALRPVEVALDPELVEAPEEYDGPSAAEIHAAIGALRPNHRAVILMREFWGLSYHEIAEQLGISHSAVETLLFRARRRLRMELEAAESPPASTSRARGVLALPLPANIAGWLENVFTTLSRSSLAVRAAGLAAAAALGTTVTLEARTEPPASPVRPVVEEPALVAPSSAPVAASSAELQLHASAAKAAADAGTVVASGSRAGGIEAEKDEGSSSDDKVQVPLVGDTGVDAPAHEVPDLGVPTVEVPALDAPGAVDDAASGVTSSVDEVTSGVASAVEATTDDVTDAVSSLP